MRWTREVIESLTLLGRTGVRRRPTDYLAAADRRGGRGEHGPRPRALRRRRRGVPPRARRGGTLHVDACADLQRRTRGWPARRWGYTGRLSSTLAPTADRCAESHAHLSCRRFLGLLFLEVRGWQGASGACITPNPVVAGRCEPVGAGRWRRRCDGRDDLPVCAPRDLSGGAQSPNLPRNAASLRPLTPVTHTHTVPSERPDREARPSSACSRSAASAAEVTGIVGTPALALLRPVARRRETWRFP